MIRIFATALAVALAAFAASGLLVGGDKAWQAPQPAPIKAIAIDANDFSLASANLETERLRFAGGLVLRSSNPHFGALSGLRVAPDGVLTAVTDTGFWFQGRLEREDNGGPAGVANGRMAPLLDTEGRPFSQKWYGDAEGLTFSDDKAYVSTEQDARVLQYGMDGDPLTAPSRIFGPPVPGGRLPYNRGLEAIATVPHGHPQAGKLLVISEAPPEPGDRIRAFLWSATAVEELSVVPAGRYYVTDAAFMPNGNLLLLERRFSPANGPAMRLREIAGRTIKPRAWLDGEALLTLDRNWQIDNMEGLAVFSGPDGSTRIGLISDDNHWPLQRTLYLEFELRNQAAAALRIARKR